MLAAKIRHFELLSTTATNDEESTLPAASQGARPEPLRHVRRLIDGASEGTTKHVTTCLSDALENLSRSSADSSPVAGMIMS